MFLLNVGYQWSDLHAANGAIFRASGQDCESLLRRDRPAHLSRVLFDPQLYLLDYALAPADHAGLLKNLSTFGWFGMGTPSFDSAETNRRDWLKEVKENIDDLWNDRISPLANWPETVRTAIDAQVAFKCTEIILPSPLQADPEDNLDSYFMLLDDAIEVASRRTNLPLLASVPMDERLLAHRAPSQSQVVEALADGLTARDRLAGVYLTLSTDASSSVLVINPCVVGSILRLSTLIGQDAGLLVVTNFVECLGLATLGFGGSAYGSGFTVKSRCLRISDYVDRSGGAAYPKFHSVRLGLEFSPEPDLERLRDARLLRYLGDDGTPAGKPVLDALSAGRDTASVPAWERRKNNVAAARLHYVQNHAGWAARDWDAEAVQTWLQDAEATWSYLAKRFEDAPLGEANGRHLGPWRRAVDELTP